MLDRKIIYTKKDQVKAWDPANRIKATHDSISELIDIDDRYFTVKNAEKVLSDGPSHTVIMLEIVPRRTQQDIMEWAKSLNQSFSSTDPNGT